MAQARDLPATARNLTDVRWNKPWLKRTHVIGIIDQTRHLAERLQFCAVRKINV